MGAFSTRISLLRLVMGAAFMLLGFYLASTTTARADDLGLLGSTSVTEKVDRVLATTTSVVVDAAPTGSTAPLEKAVGDTAATVDAVVAAPVTTLEPVAEKPAKVVAAVTAEPKKVVEAVASAPVRTVVAAVEEPRTLVAAIVAEPVAVVTSTTTTAVGGALDAVTAVVDPLVPGVVSGVLEPVVDPLPPLVPGDAPSPVVDLPGDASVVLPDSGVKLPEPLAVPENATAPGGRLDAQLTAVLGQVESDDTRGEAVRDTGSTRRPVATSVRSAGSGLGGDLPTRVPASPAAAGLQAPASAGSSSPSGVDAAIASSAFALPQLTSAAVRSALSRPSSAPALDPGSRPD